MMRVVGVVVVAVLAALAAGAEDVESRFRLAAEQVSAGDLPRAEEIYRQLAAGGVESPDLYWNWAQVAIERKRYGVAIWALKRSRWLDPSDAAIGRELARVGELAGLQPAEISPDPLEDVELVSRRLRLETVGIGLLLVSLLAHAVARWRSASRWPVAVGWTAGLLGMMTLIPPLAAGYRRPLAVVADPAAPLLDAASPGAAVLAPLREAEVVRVIGQSDGYLRIEDSSGARGWVLKNEVWELGSPPPEAGGTRQT